MYYVENVELRVKQLQFRIAKAIREGRHNKAKSLQWLLTHSYYAKFDQQHLNSTTRGLAQGGVISPTMLIITLSGLEKAIHAATKTTLDKVNVVTYADDFIVTGATKEILEQKVKPAIIKFLKERGLELSIEKTTITHIDQGFDFLVLQR